NKGPAPTAASAAGTALAVPAPFEVRNDENVRASFRDGQRMAGAADAGSDGGDRLHQCPATLSDQLLANLGGRSRPLPDDLDDVSRCRAGPALGRTRRDNQSARPLAGSCKPCAAHGRLDALARLF